jgi:hypothetical protein
MLKVAQQSNDNAPLRLNPPISKRFPPQNHPDTLIQREKPSLAKFHLINGFPSLDGQDTQFGSKTSSARSDSFSIYTVAQTPIFEVEMPVFTRYLLNRLKDSVRMSERIDFKKKAARLLRKFRFNEAADKLERCCENVTALVCENGHSFRKIVDFRCHLPFCPDCWETKAHRELSRNLPKFLQALKDDPSLIIAFMTLTLRSDRKRGLRDGCQGLKKDFAKLRERKVWNNCVGGFGRIENTFSRKFGWHPHIHNLLLLKNYIPQKSLSDAWHDVTGDSMIVDIRTVHDVAVGLVETIKYPFKPTDLLKLGKAEIQEMIDLKGEKLGVSFGVLRGLEVESDIEDSLEAENAEYDAFTEETKVLEIADCCPICQTRLDLIDFSAKNYARFLASVPVTVKME